MNISETKQRELAHFLKTVLPQVRTPGLLIFEDEQREALEKLLTQSGYEQGKDPEETITLLEAGKRVGVFVEEEVFPKPYRILVAQYEGGDIVDSEQKPASFHSLPVGKGESALVFIMTRERLHQLEEREHFPCRHQCSLTLDIS